MTQPSTAERPWPVRTVAMKVSQWVDRLGSVWVEGQITQLSLRSGARTAYMVLRDPSVDMSLQARCSAAVLERSPVPLAEGTRVIMYGKLDFYVGRGSISLNVTQIRAVGIGELLARLERLRSLLAAEGLFDPRLKRSLPFLPRRVGLITARASAAERDVLSVARERWPAVQFEVRHTTVQGPTAATGVMTALAELDADPAVDVIVIARGGGSVEDLLPFSDEALCRAIVAATTPVISAIGHEPDSPLCDYVADLRAATPTDAAKRVVPDARAELAFVAESRTRLTAALRNWVNREAATIEMLRHRPVLSDPRAGIARRSDGIAESVRAIRRDIVREIARQEHTMDGYRARLATLGPAATLARGYAVVQKVVPGADPEVVRSVADAPPGTPLRIRVADGSITAAAMGRST